MSSSAARQTNRINSSIINHPPKTVGYSTAGTGERIEVEVNSFPVDRLVDAVNDAVSGPSLAVWLEGSAHDHFEHEIVNRFAYEGDRKSGPWEPLHDATIDIRHALGVPGPGPINIRDQGLFDFVTTSRDTHFGDTWATMDLPGNPPDDTTRAKLTTAQRGSNNNPLGYGPTNPRPVLAVDESDMASLLIRLETHIMLAVVRLGG